MQAPGGEDSYIEMVSAVRDAHVGCGSRVEEGRDDPADQPASPGRIDAGTPNKGILTDLDLLGNRQRDATRNLAAEIIPIAYRVECRPRGSAYQLLAECEGVREAVGEFAGPGASTREGAVVEDITRRERRRSQATSQTLPSEVWRVG